MDQQSQSSSKRRGKRTAAATSSSSSSTRRQVKKSRSSSSSSKLQPSFSTPTLASLKDILSQDDVDETVELEAGVKLLDLLKYGRSSESGARSCPPSLPNNINVDFLPPNLSRLLTNNSQLKNQILDNGFSSVPSSSPSSSIFNQLQLPQDPRAPSVTPSTGIQSSPPLEQPQPIHSSGSPTSSSFYPIGLNPSLPNQLRNQNPQQSDFSASGSSPAQNFGYPSSNDGQSLPPPPPPSLLRIPSSENSLDPSFDPPNRPPSLPIMPPPFRLQSPYQPQPSPNTYKHSVFGGYLSDGRTGPRMQKRKQVALACTNCRRAHAKCTSERPCAPCISADKAGTCIDVPRRKRSRGLQSPSPSPSPLPSTSLNLSTDDGERFTNLSSGTPIDSGSSHPANNNSQSTDSQPPQLPQPPQPPQQQPENSIGEHS